MRNRPGRKGFTLVELLVVIGIIAVLISILLPTLNKARKQANTVKCGTYLRQFANAFQLYANDNKGYYPMSWYTYAPPGTVESAPGPGNNWTRSIRWYDFLGKYFNNGKPVNSDGTNTANATQDTISEIRKRASDSILWGCPEYNREQQWSYTSYATKPFTISNWSATDVSASRGFNGYQMNGYVVPFPSQSNGRSNAAVRGNIYSATSNFSLGWFQRPNSWKPSGQRALLFDAIHWNITMPLDWPWWDPGTWGNEQPPVPDGANFIVDFNRHGRTKIGNKPDQKTLNMLFADGHVDIVSSREAFRAVRDK